MTFKVKSFKPIGGLIVSCAFLAITSVAYSSDKVRVGLVSTLSGPAGALGVDMRDGFNLALKHLGGKLGGVTADIQSSDDQFSPDTGKQIVDRFVKRDKVDLVTGIIYSNILLAAAPVAFDAKT